jgi:acyl-CoA reductase-like NAD-dependent aldehyde dehydrogenase
MVRAAGTVKRVTLELGGKSASIVFDDADLELAASSMPGGVFANAGQDCCARSRILVQRSVFDEYVSLLEGAVASWTVGDPTDPANDMGPLVTAAHRARVGSYLAAGMGEPGGGPVVGRFVGAVPDGPGYWFPPTVVAPASPDWRMAREEIFGPVVVVIPFEDEDDAVRLANDTPYGLSGSIWTRDGARSLRMARAVQAGNLSVNSNSSVRVHTSFGGMKQSGFGRELGLEALAAYTEVKNVFVATGG